MVAERDGRLQELVEKPTADYLINAGIYVLEPAVLPLVPERDFPDHAICSPVAGAAATGGCLSGRGKTG